MKAKAPIAIPEFRGRRSRNRSGWACSAVKNFTGE